MERNPHTGICKKCGGPGPFGKDCARKDGVRRVCRTCDRKQNNKYRLENRDKFLESNRRSSAKFRKENPEKTKEASRIWWLKNGHRFLEINRVRGKKWAKANKDKLKQYKFKRRALERKAKGQTSAEALRNRISFYGGLCAYCLINKAKHIDHVIPLSRGGSNWPANLRPACANCNLSKHNKTLKEWLESKCKLLEQT